MPESTHRPSKVVKRKWSYSFKISTLPSSTQSDCRLLRFLSGSKLYWAKRVEQLRKINAALRKENQRLLAQLAENTREFRNLNSNGLNPAKEPSNEEQDTGENSSEEQDTGENSSEEQDTGENSSEEQDTGENSNEEQDTGENSPSSTHCHIPEQSITEPTQLSYSPFINTYPTPTHDSILTNPEVPTIDLPSLFSLLTPKELRLVLPSLERLTTFLMLTAATTEDPLRIESVDLLHTPALRTLPSVVQLRELWNRHDVVHKESMQFRRSRTHSIDLRASPSDPTSKEKQIRWWRINLAMVKERLAILEEVKEVLEEINNEETKSLVMEHKLKLERERVALGIY